MSDRVRGLVVASACTIVLAAGLWMLGIGGASSHTLAADGAERVLAQRVVASAVKATLRLPAAALLPGDPHVAVTDVVLSGAAAHPSTTHGHSRLYALFHVYQL